MYTVRQLVEELNKLDRPDSQILIRYPIGYGFYDMQPLERIEPNSVGYCLEILHKSKNGISNT